MSQVIVGIFAFLFFVRSSLFILVDVIVVVVIAVVVFLIAVVVFWVFCGSRLISSLSNLVQNLILICNLPVSVMSVVTYSSSVTMKIVFVGHLQHK